MVKAGWLGAVGYFQGPLEGGTPCTPSLAGGHKALVRVSSGFAENTFVTGGEDGNLCLWRARDATGTAGVC
jgi:hypothetical protein